tara:strand:- start:3308 stop:4510 length:1203 start_codon:yes stop_codon:yes gene_type:complete
MFRKQKTIIIYSHSLYIKQEKEISKIILPLADPILKELVKSGYKLVWVFRNTSKLYSPKKKSYYSPITSILQGLAVKLDSINRILNLKLINKCFAKNLYIGFFERLFWYLIFIFHQPKLVIGIEVSQELCIVARSLKIKSIELEHGLRALDSYYFRKDYRYTKSGYPDFLFYSKSKDFNIIKKLLPSYVSPIECGNIDLMHSKSEILETLSKPNISVKKSILYASTYLKRGSDKPHQIPRKLLEITQSANLLLIIRIHPKLAQNKNIFYKTIKYFEMQFNSLDFIINRKQIIYSNPYETSLWSDIIRSKGMVTLNSTAFRYAYLLSKPVLVHSNKLNEFEIESHDKGLYGFKEKIDQELWEKFINKCLNNKNLLLSSFEKIVNAENKKMRNSLDIIYKNI